MYTQLHTNKKVRYTMEIYILPIALVAYSIFIVLFVKEVERRNSL